MLNFPVLVLDEAVRPATIMAPTRWCLDVAVVVDLRSASAERQSELLTEPASSRPCVAVIGQFAAERLARIVQRVRDQFLLSPRRGVETSP